MSAESRQIFDQAVQDYMEGRAAQPELQAAARGHLSASRRLEVITEEYAEALEAGDHVLAQQLAEELAPVRAAERAVAGIVPRSS